MKFRCAYLCILIVGLLYISVIGATPARAANNVLNPFHCDFNKDGKADVLWYNTANGDMVVWYMNGFSYTSASVLPTVTDLTWEPAVCGDFLDTGNTDIAWGQSATNDVALWLENGITLSQSCTLTPPSPWKVEGIADMNGKGPLDLLWRNPNTGQHAIWYLDGCAPVAGETTYATLSDTNWRVKHTGDFNGDGNADLLWVENNTGEVAIWLMNNTAVLGSATYGPYSGWSVAKVADFNGDGKSDLLWENTSTGQISIWFMNGIAATGYANFTVPTGWEVVGADDYNGDGHVDILWWNSTSGAVALWLMNGGSIVSEHTVATVSSGWYPIAGESKGK